MGPRGAAVLCKAMDRTMDWTTAFDWNRARAFLVTAEAGSFSAAARAMGVAQPTIGRQIAALEAELELTLFERVGGGVELTAAGLALLEHVRAMGEAASMAALAAGGRADSIEGTVCVSASEINAVYVLPPIIEAIRATHPAIQLEIVASNDTADLRRREADIALRNYRPSQPDLFARKVRDSGARLYATPDYLASIGDPDTPEALARGRFFGFDRSDALLNGLRALGLPLTPAHFAIISQNQLVQWGLARRGLGICIMLEEVGDPDPGMKRALPDLPPIPVPMWLTSHRELKTSRRIRAVYDLLAEGLGG